MVLRALLANDVRAEARFADLVRFILGETGVPYDGNTAIERELHDARAPSLGPQRLHRIDAAGSPRGHVTSD